MKIEEIDILCRQNGLLKLTTSKIPTWVSKDRLEGVEYHEGTKEAISFWVREGETDRIYGEPASEKIQNILSAMTPKEQPKEPKDAAKDAAIVLMPERLTESLLDKIQKLPFSQRLLLFQNTDPRYVKKRPGRGKEYSFVEGHYMHQVLNLMSEFTWESHITGWKETEKEVICWGYIVLNGIQKSAVGQADIHFRKDGTGHLCLGDDYKAAQTDMEKKAASKFGIAVDVYRGEV